MDLLNYQRTTSFYSIWDSYILILEKNYEAIASLGRIKEKDAMTWGVLGQSYLETQNINKAIECLEFATYMDSNDLQGLFLLSQCYIANQELKMSLFYLAKCWGLFSKKSGNCLTLLQQV